MSQPLPALESTDSFSESSWPLYLVTFGVTESGGRVVLLRLEIMRVFHTPLVMMGLGTGL